MGQSPIAGMRIGPCTSVKLCSLNQVLAASSILALTLIMAFFLSFHFRLSISKMWVGYNLFLFFALIKAIKVY